MKHKSKILIVGQVGALRKSKAANAFDGLILLGFDPINPIGITSDLGDSWKAYLRLGLKDFKSCDTLFVLNNWQYSKSSRIILWLAKRYHKTIIYQPTVEMSINDKYPIVK